MKLGELLRVQLDELGGTPTWHMIFPEGEFKHPVYGDLKFDAAFLDDIKKNFDNKVRISDVFIDYKHENGESGGWIQQLDRRAGEGLYALIKWTAPGAAAVNGDLYRYFSPEFGTHFDEVTGKKTPRVLFAVALTNIPYLKRLPAITQKLSEDTEFENIDLTDVELDDYAGVPESDFAGPHRSFPIRTAADVKDAWNLRGHAADPEAVGRKIIAIARRKGFPVPHAADDQKHDETTLQDKTYPPYPSQDKPRPRKARVEGGVKEMSADDGTDSEDDDDEDDASKTKEKDMSELDVSTVHNNELDADAAAKAKKKKLRRPQGNEGPTQPTTPTGAKPSITRARTPDASGANQQMADKLETQVDDKMTLAEQKMTEQAALIKKLSERLDAIEPERVALAEEVASFRKTTLERDIRDEKRTLSEDSSYQDADGKSVAYKFAIPSVVLAQYETMALEQPSSRAATFAMLSKLREVGLAPMAEIGTARLDTSHDPDETKKFRFDDDKILAEATKIALSEGKTYASLPASEKVAFAVRAEKLVSSR